MFVVSQFVPPFVVLQIPFVPEVELAEPNVKPVL